MNDFKTWFEERFTEWQYRHGRRKTLDEFAEYLSVSQPTISAWLNGTRKPTGQNIHKIADRLGPDIYHLLGIQPPDPELQYLSRYWHNLSDDLKTEILDQTTKHLISEGIINEKNDLYAAGRS